ncbi:hypothetical protein NKH24_21755 [Mesorhizobium sp. M1300]|uniref:hypothetical protein n=1 Tax=Mesorhizobium sp. M1300 TaxID=2957077 RepID=UPI003338A342
MYDHLTPWEKVRAKREAIEMLKNALGVGMIIWLGPPSKSTTSTSYRIPFGITAAVTTFRTSLAILPDQIWPFFRFQASFWLDCFFAL